MWKILQIILLFGIAVMLGVFLHPLLSIVFLLFAKIISLFLSDVRQGYHETYMIKRKHQLLTADGERLEIVVDDDDPETLFDDPQLKENSR